MFVFGREVRILKRMRECAIEMKFDVKRLQVSNVSSLGKMILHIYRGNLSREVTEILFDKEM